MHVGKLHLQLTRNCTLECEHCMRGDRERINMNPKVLDEVFGCVDSVDTLLLTGGEPLLAIQELEHLIEVLKLKQVKINRIVLITNGTVLSDRVFNVLAQLQEIAQLDFKLSADIFHELSLQSKGLLELRNSNLKKLSENKDISFSEYGKDEDNKFPVGLINKGRTKTLSPERLSEINQLIKRKYIVNTFYEEKHPSTQLDNNIVDGTICVNVYGYIVSYGLSFVEEDKEAYETGINVLDMPCEDAIGAFVKYYNKCREEHLKKFLKKLR